MHECWECGGMCVCDMDDTMMDAPKNCRHRCRVDDGEDYSEDYSGVEDEPEEVGP